MSMQIQIQKYLNQIDFLTSTIYERNDLSNMISPEDKFMIRQGDLIITNYSVENHEKRGLTKVRLGREDGIYIFRRTHYIVPKQNQTVLIHPEHGVTVIPMNFYYLKFYTFSEGGD